MRFFLIPFASIIAALSLCSVGALAATNPDTTSTSSEDTRELPSACQITGADVTPSTTPSTSITRTVTPEATATPTGTTTATTTASDDDKLADADNSRGRAMRACIEALHAGDYADVGQTVSALAHALNADRRAAHADEDDRDHTGDAAPVDTTTPTTPSTSVTPVPTAHADTDGATPHGTGHADADGAARHGTGHDGKHGHA